MALTWAYDRTVTAALHSYRFGPSGPAQILAIHGLTGHGRRYEEIANEHLAEFSVLAPDLIGRQLVVMDWFFARYRDHLPPERILRYEQITATHGRCLLDALGLDADAAMPLQERNANRLYANVDVDTLCRRLLACEGTWWQFYSRDEVEKVHERLARAR